MTMQVEKAVAEIESAREAVRKVGIKFSHGSASVDDVNRANQRLIDANADYDDCISGRIPTR